MKIKFKGIKNKISKVPETLAKRSFQLFLFLFFVFLLISAFVFFKYAISLKEKEVLPKKVEKFNEKNLEKILKIWQEREIEFKKIDEKEYKNPF